MIVAIDIGLTGAVAVYDQFRRYRVADLLARDAEGPSAKAIRRLCGKSLRDQLMCYVPAGERPIVIFEDVRARPVGRRDGVEHGTHIGTEASLVRSRGIVEGVVDSLGWQIQVVQPQVWKRHFGLIGSEKHAALDVARRLFPTSADHLKRKKDINRADALLIAHWGATKCL